MALRSFVAALLLLAFTALPGQAQQHFTGCVSGTGSDATIVLPASADITVGGRALAAGSEVAAFTTAGTCAGVAVWTGENVVLTVWGDDVLEAGTQGFVGGERIRFRLWTEHSGVVQAGEVTFRSGEAHLQADGVYVEDGIYVVEQMRGTEGPAFEPDVVLSSEDEQAEAFRLEQNYPNPFHDSTIINYRLREPGHTTVTVYDVQGREVTQLVGQHQASGPHTVTFRAGDLPGGLYLVRLTSGEQTQTRHIVLAR